jgi:hypothetical protein
LDTYFGYTRVQWNAGREEIRDILISTAKSQSVITYSNICSRVNSISIQPHDYALPYFLGEISTMEHASGRGLLTVLVVYKGGDMSPGPGFFALAKDLGYDTSDQMKFWSEQLKRVYRDWSASTS